MFAIRSHAGPFAGRFCLLLLSSLSTSFVFAAPLGARHENVPSLAVPAPRGPALSLFDLAGSSTNGGDASFEAIDPTSSREQPLSGKVREQGRSHLIARAEGPHHVSPSYYRPAPPGRHVGPVIQMAEPPSSVKDETLEETDLPLATDLAQDPSNGSSNSPQDSEVDLAASASPTLQTGVKQVPPAAATPSVHFSTAAIIPLSVAPTEPAKSTTVTIFVTLTAFVPASAPTGRIDAGKETAAPPSPELGTPLPSPSTVDLRPQSIEAPAEAEADPLEQEGDDA